MKILTGKQIKEADRFTIENEPVDSIELMERAAEVIAQAICNEVEQGSDLLFFIGKGNNGGDGLAVARMLANVGFGCSVFMLHAVDELSEECRINFERLPESVKLIENGEFTVGDTTVVIDAILGASTKGEPKEPEKSAIGMINQLGCPVISIDMPSGMRTEFGNVPEDIIQATVTLTLEFPKLALLLPEAGDCGGEVKVLPIDLSQEYMENAKSNCEYIDEELVRGFIRTRPKFSHKGNYGHALLVCGSRGMCGAAILSTSAALRSGCGLVTVHVPEKDSAAVYASVPSAMLSLDKQEYFSTLPGDWSHYTNLGIGCGLGQHEETIPAVERLFRACENPIVIDADAIRIVAEYPEIMKLVTPGSVFTPHPGELKCLIGEWASEEEKISKVVEFTKANKVIVAVKGANTMICTPDGKLYFNSTGTPGMAKGGSGDVLTGYLTGLIARGYSPVEAAILGVYVHGKAGEKAAEYYGEEGMNSGDLVDFLAESMQELVQ